MTKIRKLLTATAFLSIFALLISASGSFAADLEAANNHFQKATDLKNSGDLDGAVQELKLAVENDPGSATYQFHLGVAYIEKNNFNDAVVHLKTATKLNPQHADAYKYLGVAYSKLSDYSNSLEAFIRAIGITPDDAVLYNDAGQTSHMLKKLEDAESYLTRAIQLDPGLAVAYVNLVNVYVEKGDFGKAVELGQKAVELDPEDSVARNNLSYAYFKRGEIKQAHLQMKKAVDLQPENANLMANLRFLEEILKEKEEEKTSPADEKKVAELPSEITLREVQQKRKLKTEEKQPEEAAPKAKEPAAPKRPKKLKEEKPVEVAEKAPEPKPEPAKPAAAKAPKPLKKEKMAVEKPKPEPKPEVAKAPPAEEKPAPAVKRPKPLKKEARAKKKVAKAPKKTVEEEKVAEKGDCKSVCTDGSCKVVCSTDKVAKAPEKPAEKEEKAPEKPAAKEKKPAKKPVAAVTPEAKKPERELSSSEKRKLKRAEKEKRLTQKQFEKAMQKTQEKRYDSARKYVDKLLLDDPANPDYRTLSAIIYDLQGFNHTAIVDLRKTIKDNPDHSNVHNAMGHANQVLDRLDEAAQEFETAHRLDPSNACASANHGSLKLLDGDTEKGEELLRIALELGCRNAGSLNNLALARYLEGDSYGAVRMIRESLSTSPENFVIRENAAFIRSKTPVKFDPITVELVHPKPFPPPKAKKDLTLGSIVPVEPLRYHEFFEKNYQTKTVVVLPFEEHQSYRGIGLSPSEQMTRELEESIKSTKHFNVVQLEETRELARLADQPELLRKHLGKHKVDILVAAEPGRFRMEDRTKKKMYGLKKKNMVVGTLPVQLRIIEAATGYAVFDGEVEGEAILDKRVSYDLTAREKRNLKKEAFTNFCLGAARTFADQFNLVTFEEPRGMVKYRVVSPPGYTERRYP